jgi:hypothetical protein
MNDEQMIWEAYNKIILESNSNDIDVWFSRIDQAVQETESDLSSLSHKKHNELNVEWAEEEYEDEDDGRVRIRYDMIFHNPDELYGFDDEAQYETIYQNDDGTYYLFSNGYHKFNSLEDAKQTAIDILNAAISQHGIGSFGVATDNSKESYKIFDVFPKRINDISIQNGWFQTKWGSWYLEAKVIIPNTEDDYVDILKLSVRDHEQKSMSHQNPDKSFYVSKNWEPKEVGNTLKKAIIWLSKIGD